MDSGEFNATVLNILDRPNKVTDIITLRELLSGNHVFRVPDYQRGYAWRKEFNELWIDILRLYRADVENRKHYTGMLALEELSERAKEDEAVIGTNAFYIVDGQQRITSLIIILKKMIDYLLEEDKDFNAEEYKSLLTIDNICKFGYSFRRNDGLQEYFYERVFGENSNHNDSNQYKSNINEASSFIEKELLKFDYEEVNKIIDLILDKIVFNLYFVTDSFDVRVTFETMNNRGKKLSKLELLKNRLMYLSTFLNPNDALLIKKDINNAWKNIYDNLSFGDAQLSDDEYLKAHWIVYKRLQKHKGDAFIDDILDEAFTIDKGDFRGFLVNKNLTSAYKYLLAYIESLSKYSKYWSFVNIQDSNLLKVDDDETAWIKRFGRLTNNLYVRSTLMVVLAEVSLSSTSKKDFYSCFERFIFVNKLLAQEKNDLSFIVTYARELMNAAPLEKQLKLEDMKKQVNEHDLAVTSKRVSLVLEAFKTYIESRSKFYYEWPGLKYFLYEYNDWLKVPSAAPIEWYKLVDVSIEHVLPQTPDKEYYQVSFKKYIGTEQQTRITNSLGNLLLLSSGSENSSLKNYSYPLKRNMSVDSGRFSYAQGSSSARKIAENDCWTPKHIYDRSKELFEFLFENWFSDIDGLDKNTWNSLVIQNNLFIFDYYKSNEEEQLKLENDLNLIDVTDERTEVSKHTIIRKNLHYHEEQILEYFDKETINITWNSKKVSYLDKVFTFVVGKNQDEPTEFRCGVGENNEAILITYKYRENKFSIKNLSKEPHYLYKKDDVLSENINRFIRSFNRYLKKQRNIEPLWEEAVAIE